MRHDLLVPMVLKMKKQHATGRKKNLQEHSYYFNSKKQAGILQNDEVNYRITTLNTVCACTFQHA